MPNIRQRGVLTPFLLFRAKCPNTLFGSPRDLFDINFFKKVWYSITKFEQYPAMATEGLPRAIKYLLTLMVAVTIFVMIGSLMQMKQTIGSLSQYIEQNIPDFTVVDGIVEMNIEQPIKIENIQYSGFDKIIVNPLAETTEQKDLVIIDDDNIKIENVSKPLIRVENNVIRHDNLKLALEIINILSK